MKILQFAFDSNESNDYLPHNYSIHSVVYTGTHDNDTTIGWFKKLKKQDRKVILEYMDTHGKNINWDLIRLAWASVALYAIVPMQDILSLGSEARMNTPGTPAGNWQWRFRKNSLHKNLAEKLKKLTRIYKR